MSDFITRETEAENLCDMHIAAKDILYMETHDKMPSELYRIKHRKGEKYKVFKWLPYPHHEERVYDRNLIEDTFALSLHDTLYTEEEVLRGDYIIENSVIYQRPFILICYGPDKKLKIRYDSTADMMKAWERFQYRFRDNMNLNFIL